MGTRIQEIREDLKAKSAQVAAAVKLGQFDSINEAIIAVFYRGNEHESFNTYMGWRAEGFQVKRGSKAFHIWSRPLDVLKPDENETDEERSRYYPVAFIFSNAQVEPITEGSNDSGKVVAMKPRNHGQKSAQSR
jgi:hypothetical protein